MRSIPQALANLSHFLLGTPVSEWDSEAPTAGDILKEPAKILFPGRYQRVRGSQPLPQWEVREYPGLLQVCQLCGWLPAQEREMHW